MRVDGSANLALTPHPRSLGSALTHTQITTDYSESLLEFISSPQHDIGAGLEELDAIHRFASSALQGEMLWSQSMPCLLPPEEQIPIAWYGSSHIGMLKHVYRRGLALRYGKAMQCIAGIHYNFSLAEPAWELLRAADGDARSAMDYQSESYISLMRNFHRYSWLLMYLFGASPAVSADFLKGRAHTLQALSADTLYLPHATSLRMSDLGYQNKAQAGLMRPYNTLREYMQCLSQAVQQSYPPYEALGTRRDNEWVQINTNLLQIENEYYATIRPKRVIHSGERPLEALCSRGVQYVEARCLDIDPFAPLGIDLETARFMDVFLLYCALEESPLADEAIDREDRQNFALTVKEGRRPGLLLQCDGKDISLREWGIALLERMAPVAQALDQQAGQPLHAAILARQKDKLQDVGLTPSAKVLEGLAEVGNSFIAFGMQQSQRHMEYFRTHPLPAAQQEAFAVAARASLQQQEQLEAGQGDDFDEFIVDYSVRLPHQLCQEG